MNAVPTPAADTPAAAEPPRWRRPLLWSALVALLVIAQTLLVWLTASYESTRAQEQVDATASGVASDIRQVTSADLQSLQALLLSHADGTWAADATALLRTRRELLRIERRDLSERVVASVDSPFQPALFSRIPRDEIDLETEVACATAARLSTPIYSRTYFLPLPDGLGMEVIDVCLPAIRTGSVEGFMAATFSLPALLGDAAGADVLRSHEVSFVEGDGTRLARVGRPRGTGIYQAERFVDLPGQSLKLRLDSAAGAPRLIPNLAVALVLGLSLALFSLVLLLVRDMRRRGAAEAALAESLAFRKAMEDSLVTGLRARDLDGRVTYVNPAFCQMVGFTADEMIDHVTPPYWPPDLAEGYAARQRVRLAAAQARDPSQHTQEGFETTFMRKDGRRFEVLIFEAPLVDRSGRHTGWMSAILDVSEQRRVEELSRQQQERLQATARLATVGEMASLLSHELNQPLAAISSYATGSLNIIDDIAPEQPPDAETTGLLRQAAERIAQQAERAGRVIKSVHDFVRRREQAREPIGCDALIDAVLPLVRLQARKSGTRVEVEMPSPAPRVRCDRTMVEQVLLNLTRNGIQAMEDGTPPADRVLLLRVQRAHERWVGFSVIDRGPGVPAEVAQRLFTPFYTTRSEGMGLGLSLCRTVIEQHGGALDFVNAGTPDVPGAINGSEAGAGRGTEFRFTLPAEPSPRTPS